MRREDLALLVGETNDNKMLLPSVKRARIAAIREDPAYHPGITTGWIVVSYTTVAKSAVPEYKIDKDLSECLSRLEMNFAREHGQLAAEKRELSGKDGTPIEFSSPDVAKAAQELSAWRAQMNQALSSISSAPPT